MTPDRHGRKPSIAELGPAWITAIATLLGAFVAVAGFFVLRASTPATSNGPSASNDKAADRTLATPVSPQPSSPAVAPGSRLAAFNVDLPGGYGLTFGTQPSRPTRIDAGTELFLTWSNGFYQPDQRGTLVTLDATTPSYAACSASTRFTSSVIFPKPGTTFCYLGHDLVVGVKVVKSLFGEYDTLAITVWQSAPSPGQ